MISILRRMLSICIMLNVGITLSAQAELQKIPIDPDITYQTMEGFGASLAYYEGWLNAHPNKAQIYEAIFGELSLDILRVRNAYDYDADMVTRVKEYCDAAELSLGHPIKLLSTSWGPPGYLKSNGTRDNGGTLRYTIDNGNVLFDYAAFAQWWDEALNEYEANGIYPSYISLQNEPDWTASYESCRFTPKETVNSTDTMAGYNKALDAVYDTVMKRSAPPKLLGPESIGIGYNVVENFVNEMDVSKLYGICHHLYHGANPSNPYSSTEFAKVGNLHPEIPHFQTEYSRAESDWWSLAGLLYKSFYDEKAVAYLYWDLVWPSNTGLVEIENPWTSGSWTLTNGYARTMHYYSFKQFSAFIHPGWKRIDAVSPDSETMVLSFISQDQDSISTVVINRSLTDSIIVQPGIPGKFMDNPKVYMTSANHRCELMVPSAENGFVAVPKSIITISSTLQDSATFIPTESIEIMYNDTLIESLEETIQLTASVLPANASLNDVFWEIVGGSENASIDQQGIVRASDSGIDTITVRASTTDGTLLYDEVEVIVSIYVPVSYLSVSSPSQKITTPLGQLQLTAHISPETATYKEVIWEITKREDLASIDQDGLLSANGSNDGTVTIRASAAENADIYDDVAIGISNQVAVSSIVVEADRYVLDTIGEELQMTAVVSPENASDPSVYWSLNEYDTIASISSKGLLTALGKGNGFVTVTATSESHPDVYGTQEVELQNQLVGIDESTSITLKHWYEEGRLFITVPKLGQTAALTVFSIDGKMIYSTELIKEGQLMIIPLDNTGNGIYLIKVEGKGIRMVEKVVVM